MKIGHRKLLTNICESQESIAKREIFFLLNININRSNSLVLYGGRAEVVQGLCEPDLLVVVLVLCLGEPGQQRRDGLHVADPGPGPRRARQGRVLAVGGHGQDGVQRVVVGGAQAAHHREQLPGGNISNR